MATRAGQRTTASAKPAPKKDSAPQKTAPTTTVKSSSKKSSKNTVELTGHAFPAGTEVSVFPALGVGPGYEQGEIKSAKVSDNGVLKVSGLDYGQYTAVADVEVEHQVDKNSPNRQAAEIERRTLNFVVKDEKKIREEKFKRTAGIPLV